MIILENLFRENSYERVERERKAQGGGANEICSIIPGIG